VQAAKDISERIRKGKEAVRTAKKSPEVPSTTARAPLGASASVPEWSREVAERLIIKAGKHGGLGCCFGGSEKFITLPKEVWIKHAAILAAAEAMPDAPAPKLAEKKATKATITEPVTVEPTPEPELTNEEKAAVAACRIVA
jgi:hypothetical protein